MAARTQRHHRGDRGAPLNITLGLMNRTVAIAILLGSLWACTSGFKDEHEFQAYISNMKLSTLSLADASNRLNAEGFTCAAEPSSKGYRSARCERSIKGFPCNQRHWVVLAVPVESEVPLTVTSRFGLICL
jgi:hypothetical protein